MTGKKGLERRVQREAAVIKYLLNHPESTSEQVWKATGCRIMENTRFLSQRRLALLPTVWTVNELKYRRYLRTGNITGGKKHDEGTRSDFVADGNGVHHGA